jgi:hypothetical protein
MSNSKPVHMHSPRYISLGAAVQLGGLVNKKDPAVTSAARAQGFRTIVHNHLDWPISTKPEDEAALDPNYNTRTQ